MQQSHLNAIRFLIVNRHLIIQFKHTGDGKQFKYYILKFKKQIKIKILLYFNKYI